MSFPRLMQLLREGRITSVSQRVHLPRFIDGDVVMVTAGRWAGTMVDVVDATVDDQGRVTVQFPPPARHEVQWPQSQLIPTDDPAGEARNITTEDCRVERHDERCGFRVGYRCECRPFEQGPAYGYDTIEHRAAAAIANHLNIDVDGDDLRHALAAHSLLIVDLDFAEEHLPRSQR